MNVLLFGATGMVGQGVLRECLLDPEVERVLAIGRTSCGQQHKKLRELLRKDLSDYSGVENELTGFDACFFCLGVSSAGMTEEAYRRVTYDLTLAAAQTLVKLNPDMTFIYVSGAGTDSSEHGRTMWARVKGKTENDLLRLPFKAVYIFRPAAIQPLHGITSRTKLYRLFYLLFGWTLSALKPLFPKYITTTEQIGLAMLNVAKHGYAKHILENDDINSLRNPGQSK
jgi:uncharacterized protein YbjT (DUF2867 family)